MAKHTKQAQAAAVAVEQVAQGGMLARPPEVEAWLTALAATKGSYTKRPPSTMVLKPGPAMLAREDRNPKTGKSRDRVQDALAQMDRLAAAGKPLTVGNLLARDPAYQNTYTLLDLEWDLCPNRKAGALWVAE